MTHLRHDSPTCDTALNLLEPLWLEPIPNDRLDEETAAAWEHVRGCPACATKLEQRREADHRIANAMLNVPIPIGLKQRLLAGLNSAVRVEALKPNSSSLRRRASWVTIAAALLVCVAGGSWIWIASRPQGIPLQTLIDNAPLTSVGLTPIADISQMPSLPPNWFQLKGLRLTSAPYWFRPNPKQSAVAWIPFELPMSRQPTTRGVLLAAFRSSVTDPPAEWIAQPPRTVYSKRGTASVAIAGWSERGVVYVCVVSGNSAQLERLLRLTAPTAA